MMIANGQHLDNEIVNPEEAPDREPERPYSQCEADQMYRRKGRCHSRVQTGEVSAIQHEHPVGREPEMVRHCPQYGRECR